MVSMAEQSHTSLRSACIMHSVGWSGVKLTAIGLWSSGNAFSGAFLLLHDNAPMPKVRSIQKLFVEIGVEELD